MTANPLDLEEHLQVTPITISPSTMIEWTRPEPLSALARRCIESLQPGDYEIYDEKLRNFLEEAREVFVRSGVTGMLRAGDLIVAVYTANGDLANASAGTYLHCVTAMLPVKFVMSKYYGNPTVGVQDGDIFYANEARYGGIHNPDQMAFMPVFHGGELIAWVAALTHNPETGAIEPGGMPVTARSRHDEGMKLTPIKIGENFRIRDDMLDMMENFTSRAARMQAIDVRARITGCDRLRRRISELAADRGNDFVRGLLAKLIVEAEQATRRRISRWKDGVYRSTAFMDTIGPTSCLVRGSLAATKHGSDITFDFTGTSPENDGPYNCFPHITAAHAAVTMYAFQFHDLPVSNGALAPFTWIVPEGTVFNADPDAAISSSPMINSLTVSVVQQVFARMMFSSEDRPQVTGNICCQPCSPLVAGPNQHGVPVAELDNALLNTDGHGARQDRDGVDAYGFAYGHATRAPDTEDSELEQQFLRLYFRLRADSGGVGTFRGGTGTEAALVLWNVPFAAWAVYATSSYVPITLGVFGGYPAASAPGISVRNTDLSQKFRRGDADIPRDTIELATQRAIQGEYHFEHTNRPTRAGIEGDVIVATTGGGGGYGDPLARDPELVVQDIRDEAISEWTARTLHGVVYDPATLLVDHDATKAERAKARKERLSRGKPWAEFQAEWSTLRPAEHALTYFGSWPEGVANHPLERT
ncbi:MULTISPECIES: hydantoinase B/oxoprolinase family protein [Prauserella salsuginis group]|uniref:Hydantoinase B/oxoprolinase family protein n=1 Tax=Prauserella salsuginis TaxID=387889 RepID=A0ABW6G0Q8_9PSEU|nr:MULTISPECIES: hydantoinase B/oxoprolinase family protein [Prauserella salsuginis group]MCR3721949.1 acetophenone carboxylase [Prauserella flava]MCR3735955.1 acetophenone carboxylase [Prauserella salsuginis]